MTDTPKNELSARILELKKLANNFMSFDPKGDGKRLGMRLGEAFKKDLEIIQKRKGNVRRKTYKASAERDSIGA